MESNDKLLEFCQDVGRKTILKLPAGEVDSSGPLECGAAPGEWLPCLERSKGSFPPLDNRGNTIKRRSI